MLRANCFENHLLGTIVRQRREGEGFPIEEQWPKTTNCLCFTLDPHSLGKGSAFIGRLRQTSCAHISRYTGFSECGRCVCWIEQISKAPESIRDQGKRQNNLHTTSGRMRHPHSALSFADTNAQSRLAQKEVHLNATELARAKFNALFAAHDAKDERAAAQEEKLALKTSKKAPTKNVKPQ